MAREPGQSLPGEVTVYGAIRSRSWLDKDTGAVLPVGFYVLPVAFYLRDHSERGAETGLSVSETPEGAASGLRKCHGVIPLPVGRVRDARAQSKADPLSVGDSLGLNVVADPTAMDPDHAEIRGVPEWTPAVLGENSLADHIASVLAEIANASLRSLSRSATSLDIE